MTEGDPMAPGAPALAELKASLRIGHVDEDPLLARLIASATELGEQFTGQAILIRNFTDLLPASGSWTRLRRLPVRAIASAQTLEEGAPVPLASTDYAIDLDAGGHGWVRLTAPIAARTVRVGYSAGLADNWEGVPEPLRQGAIRLAAHLYTHRDGASDEGPPAVVTALWRPYRRMRLS